MRGISPSAHVVCACGGKPGATRPLTIFDRVLYAIQEGDDGPVKLGTTLDIFSRLGQLQTSHYKELRLRALWAGDRADEKALHSRFAHLHLHLEWFAWTPELDAYIRERAATAPRALRQLGAAADSRRRRKTGSAVTQPVRRKTRAAVKRPVPRLAPAPLAADRLEHPTWNDHAMLGGDAACSAEDWIAVLCDIAPSLTTEHLLTYVELLSAADRRGRLRVDLATLAQRVLHQPDPADAARLLADLHDRVLPDAGGAYRELPSARLSRLSWCAQHRPHGSTRISSRRWSQQATRRSG